MHCTSISAFWKRLSHLTLSDLSAIVGDKIPAPPANPSFLERIFTQERTFWLFLGQVLSARQTCKEAVIKSKAWLELAGQSSSSESASPSSSSNKKKQLYLLEYGCLLSGTPSFEPGLP